MDNKEAHLRHLVHHGTDQQVMTYIEANEVNINASDDWDTTVLHWAVMHGRFHIVKYLIEKVKAHIMVQDEDGANILHLAAFHGKFTIMRYLIEEVGMPLTHTDHGKMNVLQYAIMSSHLNIIKYLVHYDIKVIQHKDVHGNTVFHTAVSQESLDILKYLTSQVDKQVIIRIGGRLLYLAALMGNVAAFKYIRETFSIHKDYMSSQDGTLLHGAAESGCLPMVKHLLEDSHSFTWSHIHTIMPNNGQKPLHIAATHGHLDIVKYFIENIPMTHTYNRQDMGRALYLSVMYSQTTICHYLMTHYFLQSEKITYLLSLEEGQLTAKILREVMPQILPYLHINHIENICRLITPNNQHTLANSYCRWAIQMKAHHMTLFYFFSQHLQNDSHAILQQGSCLFLQNDMCNIAPFLRIPDLPQFFHPSWEKPPENCDMFIRHAFCEVFKSHVQLFQIKFKRILAKCHLFYQRYHHKMSAHPGVYCSMKNYHGAHEFKKQRKEMSHTQQLDSNTSRYILDFLTVQEICSLRTITKIN